MTTTITGGLAPTSSEMLNGLRRGTSYLATTVDGRSAFGEYLGIEVNLGDRSILLRHEGATASIAVEHLVSLHPQTG